MLYILKLCGGDFLLRGDEQRIGLVLNYVRSNLKISDLIKSFGRYSSEVDKGGYVMIACPFHEDALPSFSIDDKKGVCHCFSCGFGGSYVSVFRKLWKAVYYSDISFVVSLDMILESNPEISVRLGFRTVREETAEIIDSGFRSKRLRPERVIKPYGLFELCNDMKVLKLNGFEDIALAQALIFSDVMKLPGILDVLRDRLSMDGNVSEEKFLSASDLLEGLMD
jgi:hypothetical protein